MKLHLYQIVNAGNSFLELKKNNEMPFSLAWLIDDVLEPLDKHLQRFNEEKNKLVKELGEPDKDKPDMYAIKAENIATFNDKINEISQTIIEIKNPVKINKKELFDSDIKINGNVDLTAMKLFIKE